ncbi:MAG: hypothetical protein ACRC4T_10805 [Cetobacterium sp.]
MKYINFLIYILLVLSIISVEIKRKKKGNFDMLSAFNLFYLVFYGISGICMNLYKILDINFKYEQHFEMNTPTYFIVIFYFVFLLGYLYKIKIRINIKSFDNVNISKVNIIFLVILIIFIVLYSSGYGGIMKTIEYSNMIRSGHLISHKFSFLQRFFSLAPLISCTYYVMYKYQNKSILYFQIANIITIISLLMINGRALILYYIINLVIIDMNFSKKNLKKYLKLLILIIFTYLLIKYGKRAFTAISLLLQGDIDKYLSKLNELNLKKSRNLIENFTHTIISTEMALKSEFRRFYLSDFISAIFSLIPGVEGFTGEISYDNTFFILGISNNRSMPPGIVASFIYYYGIYLVFPVAFIYGLFWGAVDKIFRRIYTKNINLYPLYLYIAWQLGNKVYAASPVGDLNRLFYLIFYIMIILFFKKIGLLKIKQNKVWRKS